MNKIFHVFVVLYGALIPMAHAQSRLPPVPPENYDEDQKKAAAAFLEERKVPVFGPFEILMHSPKVMTAAREMGDHLRYKSAIGTRLSELVILVTARFWSQTYEWSLHAPIALKQGIGSDVIDAIAEGRYPPGMEADEEICYQFSTELLANKNVSDATYKKAEARFGDKGVVDLAAISGYYALLAMQLNISRVPPVPDGPVLKPLPE
jgi:4-carboxymuconolactone decarboxylase